jgi:hypothetical protein
MVPWWTDGRMLFERMEKILIDKRMWWWGKWNPYTTAAVNNLFIIS